MRGLETRHHPSPHRMTQTPFDPNATMELLFDIRPLEEVLRRLSEMHHHPSPRRPVMVMEQSAVETNHVEQLRLAFFSGLDLVPSNEVQLGGLNGLLQSYPNAPRTFGDILSMAQAAAFTTAAASFGQQHHLLQRSPLVNVNVLLENYHRARHINPVQATLYLVRGIIDHIERGEAIDALASFLFEPSTIIIIQVSDGDAAAGGGWHRNGWASTSRLFRGGSGANNPLEPGDGVARPNVHSEPSTIIISQVADGDDAAGGGWRRNGWASANRLFRGGGSANNPFWMSLWSKLSSTLSILGVGDINNLKGGSLALSLIPFFVDKQPPLNTQDKIYMGIAFCCGVLAFVTVPLRVPSAESTRVARNRQAIGVTILIIGVVMFMVTAVDEKLRLLVLFLVLACLLFSLYLEKREANETQLLPL